MMSFTTSKPESGSLQEAIGPIVRVLSQLGGHFTFTDANGEQFVIVKKSEFEAVRKAVPRQLPLTAAKRQAAPLDSVDTVLDRINREIALHRMKQDEELADDLGLEDVDDMVVIEEVQIGEEEQEAPLPPPVRVRFEPLRGDLPPDLQE